MPRKLSSIWTIGVEEGRKEEYVQTILNSTIVIDRLNKIVDDYLEQLEQDELNEDHFNNPEWAVRQAHILGRKRELRRLKTIIAFGE